MSTKLQRPLHTVLDVAGLSIRYGDFEVLSNVSLSIGAGEMVGLVGESGSGKSTLALSIMSKGHGSGMETLGTVSVLGNQIVPDAGSSRFSPPDGCALVFQEPAAALNPVLTIGEQLAEVCVYRRGMSWQDARSEALSALVDVELPQPEAVLDAFPFQLSGGQQQRAVLAMALLSKPKVLLLDEPTTGLDASLQASAMALVRKLAAREGAALLFISHNLALVAQTCDRVAVMYLGQIVEEAPTQELFASPQHPYTRALIDCIPGLISQDLSKGIRPIRGTASRQHAQRQGCRFAPRCGLYRESECDRPIPLVGVAPSHSARCVRVSEDFIQDDIPAISPRAANPERDEIILSVAGLRKTYGRSGAGMFRSSARRRVVAANRDLNFDVARGEILAVVGESGSGKSTLSKILAGLERADAGSATFGGFDLARLSVEKRTISLLRDIRMIQQNPDEALNPSFTIGQQIKRTIERFDQHSGENIDAQIVRILDEVKLQPEIANALPRRLSGGQKQRVAIACAFIGKPQLIIADEPLSALDVSVSASIVELLLSLQRKYRTAMVLVSHDIEMVRFLADRVVVMNSGQIVDAGSVVEVFSPPRHDYTRMLLDAVPRLTFASSRDRQPTLSS